MSPIAPRRAARAMIRSLLDHPQVEVTELCLREPMDLEVACPGVSFGAEIGAIARDLHGFEVWWGTAGKVEPALNGGLRLDASPFSRPRYGAGQVRPLLERHAGVIGARRTATEITDELVAVGPDEVLRPLQLGPAQLFDLVVRTRGAWPVERIGGAPAHAAAYLDHARALFDVDEEALAFLGELR